jgi:cytochrome c
MGRVALAFVLVLTALSPVLGHAQDLGAGGRVYMKCGPCHSIGAGATSKVGPPLNGIVGAPAAAFPYFPYSPALRAAGLTWDEPTLREFLRNPRAKVPMTKMAFAGLASDADLDNLIAFLKFFGPNGEERKP